MPLDVIRTISDTEREASDIRAEYVSKAKKLLEETAAAGKALIARSEQEAGRTASERLQQAEQAAAKQTETVMSDGEAQCAQLRKTARERKKEASKIIVQRVVKG